MKIRKIALYGDNTSPEQADQERRQRSWQSEQLRKERDKLDMYSKVLGKRVSSEDGVMKMLRIVGEIGQSRENLKQKVERLIEAYGRA